MNFLNRYKFTTLTTFGLKINCKTLMIEEKHIRQAEAYKEIFEKPFCRVWWLGSGKFPDTAK